MDRPASACARARSTAAVAGAGAAARLRVCAGAIVTDAVIAKHANPPPRVRGRDSPAMEKTRPPRPASACARARFSELQVSGDSRTRLRVCAGAMALADGGVPLNGSTGRTRRRLDAALRAGPRSTGHPY